ncbi:MAG TPA: nicotinate phosphoribosyltransferase [Acidimicrobiia bacterium]|nr:nicotinate phosphoribosyltransferase [Acidimicrobiia bacterium]
MRLDSGVQNHLAGDVLLTDQYQLTMAQLYFRQGLHEQGARFEHFFRSYPDYGSHQAGYAIAAGLRTFVDWLNNARFDDFELDVLAHHPTLDGGSLFAKDFLDYLRRNPDFGGLEVSAIPEGRVVHPGVPLTVVEGPLLYAQLIETALLNHINFETLIATKASRVLEAARGGTVLEFGARRAQGSGAHSVVRAALIGGAAASSLVGRSHELGFLPRGTHAHSMVQAFMALGSGELGAFQAYAEVYPDECLLLVDTVDTLESGVPNAITVFEDLRRQGHRPIGIRLDSGDLAHLAVRSAEMLNRAGFDDTSIVLSSELDEITIWQILEQIADEAPRYGVDPDHLIKRLVYGVGSRLATSQGDPYLDGVYKLVSIKDQGEWKPAIKVSDTPAKVITPGAKKAWRIYDQRGIATVDLLALAEEQPQAPFHLHHPTQSGVHRTLSAERVSGIEELIHPVATNALPTPHEEVVAAQARRVADLERLDPGVRRLVNPHVYHVSLTEELARLKQDLINQANSD